MQVFRLENVVIFPEKSEFILTRGGRTRNFIIHQGKVMIRINGFENYYLCLKTGEVFSKRKSAFVPLKREMKGGHAYYRLFVNGFQERVSLFRIMKENFKEIERFFGENRAILKGSDTEFSSSVN